MDNPLDLPVLSVYWLRVTKKVRRVTSLSPRCHTCAENISYVSAIKTEIKVKEYSPGTASLIHLRLEVLEGELPSGLD